MSNEDKLGVISEGSFNLESNQGQVSEKLHRNIKEEIFLPEIGTRDLTDDQVESLRYNLNYIFDGTFDFDTINKMSKKLAILLIENDINFESALNLWERLNADIDILNKVYSNPIENQINLSFVEICSEKGENVFDPKTIQKTESDIKKIIQLPVHFGMITRSMGTNTNLLIDPSRKQTFYETVRYTSKGDAIEDETLVIDACLDKLTVFDSPLGDELRKFTAEYKTNLKHQTIKIGPVSVSELYNTLVESGYVSNSRYGKDINTMSLNTFIQRGLAEVKSEIENPGFFHDEKTDEIIVVKYLFEEQPREKLKEALDLLEEFCQWFPNHIDKVVTVFKWSLIAPFIFAMKQRGSDVQWLYLYGRGGSGKTTLGKMGLYLWGKPDKNSDIGGSGFNTEYRIGNRLKQSTFPIVVNEPDQSLKILIQGIC